MPGVRKVEIKIIDGIEHKKCSNAICIDERIWIPLSDFSKSKNLFSGYQSRCKKCRNIHNNEMRQNPEIKKKNSEYNKIRYKNPEIRNKILEYRKNRNKNPEIRKKNLENSKKYNENRKKIDPIYKMKHHIRSLIGVSLKRKRFKKQSRTHEILGCSYGEFLDHLNDNKRGLKYGEGDLHLDHIIPISLAKTEEEVLALSHWTNFRLLSREDNIKKRNNLPSIFELHPKIPSLAFEVFIRNV